MVPSVGVEPTTGFRTLSVLSRATLPICPRGDGGRVQESNQQPYLGVGDRFRGDLCTMHATLRRKIRESNSRPYLGDGQVFKTCLCPARYLPMLVPRGRFELPSFSSQYVLNVSGLPIPCTGAIGRFLSLCYYTFVGYLASFQSMYMRGLTPLSNVTTSLNPTSSEISDSSGLTDPRYFCP